LLRAFRKQSGLKQQEIALRLGVTQQTFSAMERNADRMGASRLLHLLMHPGRGDGSRRLSASTSHEFKRSAIVGSHPELVNLPVATGALRERA